MTRKKNLPRVYNKLNFKMEVFKIGKKLKKQKFSEISKKLKVIKIRMINSIRLQFSRFTSLKNTNKWRIFKKMWAPLGWNDSVISYITGLDVLVKGWISFLSFLGECCADFLKRFYLASHHFLIFTIQLSHCFIDPVLFSSFSVVSESLSSNSLPIFSSFI